MRVKSLIVLTPRASTINYRFVMNRLCGKRMCLSKSLEITDISNEIPYFIVYNVHESIVRSWISRWFLAKKLFLFFKNNFKRNNHCMFINHKSYLKPFLSCLPYIVRREYFFIIFNVKKCALYSIKYGTSIQQNLSIYKTVMFYCPGPRIFWRF